MTAREYLLTYQEQRRRLQRKRERVQNLKASAQSLHGIQYGERVQVSHGKGGAQYSIMEQSIDLEREYREECVAFVRLGVKLDDFVFRLKDFDQIQVIRLRYLSGLNMYDIADEIGKSYDRIRRLHWQGMKELENLLSEYGGKPDIIPPVVYVSATSKA